MCKASYVHGRASGDDVFGVVISIHVVVREVIPVCHRVRLVSTMDCDV